MRIRNPNRDVSKPDYIRCVQAQLDFLAEYAGGFAGPITATETEDVSDSYERGVSVDACAKYLR